MTFLSPYPIVKGGGGTTKDNFSGFPGIFWSMLRVFWSCYWGLKLINNIAVRRSSWLQLAGFFSSSSFFIKRSPIKVVWMRSNYLILLFKKLDVLPLLIGITIFCKWLSLFCSMSYHDDVSDIRLLDDEETISLR